MTTRPPSRAAVTRAEFEALEAQQAETHRLVANLHRQLAEPQPGHTRSLIDRMAEVTIRVETGERTLSFIVRLGAALAALGAIVAALRFGATHE